MSKKKDFRPIYARVLSHCPPYHHEGLWQDVAMPDDVRRSPPDPVAALADLRTQYSNAVLLESGVAVTAPDVDIQLAPALCDGKSAIIALRKTPKQAPFDLLTDGGCVAPGKLPLCSSLGDSRVRKMIDTKKPVLCATCSTDDAVVLQSLGIPATLASGLAELSGDYLNDLCNRFGLGDCSLDRPGIVTLPKYPPPAVVLVGWNPKSLTMKEPEGVAKIVAHLADVERHLGICLETFCVWTPTQAELDGIAFRKAHFELSAVKVAIRTSMRSSTRSLVPVWQEDKSPKDLGSAIKQLKQLRGRFKHITDEERQAAKHFQRMLDSKCIAPWFEQLEGTEDAVERNLLTMAAITSEMSHAQGIKILLRRCGDPKQNEAWRPNGPQQEEFQQFVQTSGLLLKTVKEMVQYEKNRCQF